MTTTAQLEQQLLTAAGSADMSSVMHIVTNLTAEQKDALNELVLDEVLVSIARRAEPVASHNTLLIFMRAIGSRLSTNSVNLAMEVMSH